MMMSAFDEDDRLRSVVARDVKKSVVSWLWQGRIPLGAITLLDGDPGLGKSLLTIDLAARVTTMGREMPALRYHLTAPLAGGIEGLDEDGRERLAVVPAVE